MTTTLPKKGIHTAYSPKERVQISFPKIGRTKQADAEKSDINNIMKKFLKTGVMTFTNKNEPQYGFANSETFHESLEIIRKSEEMFQELPSKLRQKFNHDPGEFLDFVSNEENRDKLYDLGLSNSPIYTDYQEEVETEPQSTATESTVSP